MIKFFRPRPAPADPLVSLALNYVKLTEQQAKHHQFADHLMDALSKAQEQAAMWQTRHNALLGELAMLRAEIREDKPARQKLDQES